MSSLHAVAAAREMADPGARVEGAKPGLTLYTSAESHSSIEKAAIALGIGQKNVRKVPVDDEFRMMPDALAQAIEADVQQGKRPFCVVATVGTTSSTSVDPVAAIVEVAEQHNLWLHIDAAYAGPAAILPECQHILKGAERAHSLVMNPHKWLFTPVDLSAFYTRRPDILRRAFSLNPEYLRASEDPRAHQPDGLRHPAGPALPLAQAVVPDALLRTRAPATGPARAYRVGKAAGGDDPPRRALRSSGASAVLGGVLPLQGQRRRQPPRCWRR